MKSLYYRIISREKFGRIFIDIGFIVQWLFDFNKRRRKLLWKIRPFTMVNYPRLKNIYEICKKVEEEKLKGSFVECGVWKGGCSAIMAKISQKYGNKRKIYLFDSFQGLPETSEKDGINAKIFSENKSNGMLISINKNVAKLSDVKELFFKRLDIENKNIKFCKGWFQETIPKEKKGIGEIAILRLDGDWYESTKFCLENLYNQVVKGGYIIIDDYGFWEGCKRAVDEFFKERKIKPNLIKIDISGVYLIKD